MTINISYGTVEERTKQAQESTAHQLLLWLKHSHRCVQLLEDTLQDNRPDVEQDIKIIEAEITKRMESL